MLTLLIGIDLPELVVFIVILAVIGTGVFYAIRPLIRRIFPGWSARSVATTARVIAFVLPPVLLALAFYIALYDQFNPSEEHIEQRAAIHYGMMEEELNRDLTVGMPKADALMNFAITDTAQSSYELDLSLAGAKTKYILELKFEGGKLKEFGRVE